MKEHVLLERKRKQAQMSVSSSLYDQEINILNREIRSMKINDVVVEAPMGLLKRAGLGIKKMVPGSAGHKAQGQLDTGRVANEWKKQYSVYLGRINQEPSTENLTAFLKQLGLDDDLVGSTVSEQLFIERALTKPEVDKLLLTAAQKAARGPTAGSTTSASTPTAGDGAVPGGTDSAAEPAAGSKPGLLSRAASAVKKAIGSTSKPATGSAARVEPSVATPAGAATSATSPAPAATAPAKNLDSYVNNWAKSINAAKSQPEKVALAKEIINFLKDRQGSPEASRAAAIAKATLKRQAEPAVRKIAQSSAFAMERKIYSVANKLLEAVGLSWKDLGFRILVTESTADYVVIGNR